METVRAELVSTKERFGGIRLAEFHYTYICDGKKHENSSFNLVTADHDLNIVWTIDRTFCEYGSSCPNTHYCTFNSIKLQNSDKVFFGSFEIQVHECTPFTTTFDSNSLPLCKDNLPQNWCPIGCYIKIKIQIYREFQMPSLTVNFNDELLKDKNFSDVTFIIGDEEVPANKRILSLHSQVFAKMFESDMIEKKTGRVEITDIEPDVFKMLLNSILSGKLECNDFDELLKLIVVADKYEIRNLVDLCAYKISYKVTADNAIDVFMLADQVRSEFLRNDCTDFIIKNKDEIIATESYKNIAKSGRADLSLLKHLLNVWF